MTTLSQRVDIAVRKWGLFDTVPNFLLTLSVGAVAFVVLYFIGWQQLIGANWSVVTDQTEKFFVGSSLPDGARWAIWLQLFLGTILLTITWGAFFDVPQRQGYAIIIAGVIVIVCLTGPLDSSAKWTLTSWFSTTLLVLSVIGIKLGRHVFAPPNRTVIRVWGLPIAWLVMLVATFGLIIGPADFAFIKWGGLYLNLVLTFVVLVFSGLVGSAIGIMRTSPWTELRILGHSYTRLMTGLPLLPLMIIASLIPIELLGQSPDVVVYWVLGVHTLYAAAFVAEGIPRIVETITTREREAGQVLGLNYLQVEMNVVWPQARRILFPFLLAQFMAVFTGTSLVSLVGLSDILGEATNLLNEYKGTESQILVFIITVYWAIGYLTTRAITRLSESSQHQGPDVEPIEVMQTREERA